MFFPSDKYFHSHVQHPHTSRDPNKVWPSCIPLSDNWGLVLMPRYNQPVLISSPEDSSVDNNKNIMIIMDMGRKEVT